MALSLCPARYPALTPEQLQDPGVSTKTLSVPLTGAIGPPLVGFAMADLGGIASQPLAGRRCIPKNKRQPETLSHCWVSERRSDFGVSGVHVPGLRHPVPTSIPSRG